MTQQPFSRGAIDLSALKRPAAGSGGAPGGGGVAGSYVLDVTTENFQQVLEMSMTAPVLLVLFSRTRMPESGQLADDMATLAGEFEGRFLVGRVDVDTSPQIAQAMQVQSVPLVVAVLDGRPAPLLQDVVPLEELRTALTQVVQGLAAQGMTARHQPLSTGGGDEDGDEEGGDPRYAAAEDALARDDIDGAVAEYQKLIDANPADAEAAAGLAMAQVLQRTQGADSDAVRAAADAAPADVDAQTLAADVELAEGRPVEAFGRLIELVRITSDKDRDRAREHLIGLFAAVGNDDPTVLQARQRLASALF